MENNVAFTSALPQAFIGINKNRLKIYNDNIVFLENDQEYQFEFYNPTSQVYGILIYIDDNLISNRKLVIKPGERIWLDRFIDSNNKFKFQTYQVDDNKRTKEAIKNNGNVRIEFYKESTKRLLLDDYKPYLTYTNCFGTDTNYNVTYCSWNEDESKVISSDTDRILRKVETGRTEKGGSSAQKFENAYYDFESFSYSISYKILPISQKNTITTNEIKLYCSNCGSKLRKKNWKFCPSCGSKI